MTFRTSPSRVVDRGTGELVLSAAYQSLTTSQIIVDNIMVLPDVDNQGKISMKVSDMSTNLPFIFKHTALVLETLKGNLGEFVFKGTPGDIIYYYWQRYDP